MSHLKQYNNNNKSERRVPKIEDAETEMDRQKERDGKMDREWIGRGRHRLTKRKMNTKKSRLFGMDTKGLRK